MNDLLYSIIIPALIIILPFWITYYRGNTSDVKKAIIWSIISTLISFLLLKVIKIDINLIYYIISIILSTLFNIGIIKEKIDGKNLPKFLLVFGLFFVSTIFQLIPIYLFKLDLNNLTTNQETLLTLFSDSILVIILIILYRKELIEQFKTFKKNLYPYLDTGFKYWLIGLMVMVVSNLLINLLVPSAVAGNEEQVQQIIHGSPIISFICVGILAPIIEEITFRKAFRDLFKTKWLFIIISGLVFGGLHVIFSFQGWQDLLYIIPYSSLGIAFGFVLVKTENIYPSICIHMFHNSVLTLFSIISSLVILW